MTWHVSHVNIIWKIPEIKTRSPIQPCESRFVGKKKKFCPPGRSVGLGCFDIAWAESHIFPEKNKTKQKTVSRNEPGCSQGWETLSGTGLMSLNWGSRVFPEMEILYVMYRFVRRVSCQKEIPQTESTVHQGRRIPQGQNLILRCLNPDSLAQLQMVGWWCGRGKNSYDGNRNPNSQRKTRSPGSQPSNAELRDRAESWKAEKDEKGSELWARVIAEPRSWRFSTKKASNSLTQHHWLTVEHSWF